MSALLTDVLDGAVRLMARFLIRGRLGLLTDCSVYASLVVPGKEDNGRSAA